MEPPEPARGCERAVVVAGAICGGLGLVVLAGWHLHLPVLVQVRPHLTPTQYNTALSFLLCGTALMALGFARRRIAVAAAAIVFALAALTGMEFVFGVDLHIDRLLFEPYLQLIPAHPGRMAPNTVVAMLAGSVSLLALGAARRQWLWMAGAAAALASGIAVVSAAGYLSSLGAAYRWGDERPMAVLTTLGLIALGSGLWRAAWQESARHEIGWPRWLPLAVAVGFGSVTLLLWRAFQVERPQEPLASWAAQAALVLSVLSTAAVAYAVHLAGAARAKSRQLQALNFLLEAQIQQRRRAEEDLAHKNRALRVVNECNQALVHAVDENELLQRICDLVVNLGGYRLAWVGYAEQDQAKNVRAMAAAGMDKDYAQSGAVTWADADRGRGPTGAAIRTGVPQLCRDTLTDPLFAPWRERALAKGFRSSLALPLLSGGAAFGALSIHAPEPNAFDDTEISLLTELAADLAFGVRTLRARAEHDRGSSSCARPRATPAACSRPAWTRWSPSAKTARSWT